MNFLTAACGGIDAFLDFVDDDVPFHLTHTEGKGLHVQCSHHGHEKLQPILKKKGNISER